VPTVEEAFEALLDEHRRIGSPLGQYLRPGRSEAEVRSALRRLELDVPDELVAWFGRQDGIDHERHRRDRAAAGGVGGRLGLYYPNAFPYGLDEAAAQTADLRARRSALVPYVDPDERWRDDWLAVVMTEPEWVVVECHRGPTAPIWRVSWDVDEEVSEQVLPGIGAYLEAITSTFRRDRYVWNEEYGLIHPVNPSNWSDPLHQS
jgi:hypothetical protein